MSCELLAPAGNPEMALAALDAGADALYLGLERFSARARAGNFTSSSLGSLIDFAHARGRRIHVAVNTLVKENELDALAETLAELRRLEPDALIVQDAGVVRLAREYFPGLVLHGSTQMGIHNPGGIETAARMGLARVILERQMTLEEVRLTAARAQELGIETEVFIHGSLCSSLSGRCLWSSWLGGESGNRGRCKQPCRRAYRDGEGRDAGFVWSMCDLETIDWLAEFRALGIASLKIEGRLRSPDYVWKTVRAYRVALDDPSEAGRAEARKILAQTPSRSPGPGFYHTSSATPLTRPHAPGVFGAPVGKVTGCNRRALNLALSARIHLGDRLRLVPPDGGEGEAFTLIRLNVGRRDAVAAGRGDKVEVPGGFPSAAPGFLVYKIGENGCDYRRRAAALPPGRTPVVLRPALSGDGLQLEVPVLRETFVAALPLTPARQHACDAAQLTELFSAGAPLPWRPSVEDCRIDGEWFLPLAQQKSLRRAFWDWAAPRLDAIDPCPEAAAALARFRADYAAGERGAAEPFPPLLPEASGAEVRIPGFVPATEESRRRDRVREAYRAGARRFVVGGWHGFAWLADCPGVEIVAAPPLAVCNSPAAEEFAALGATALCVWPELEHAAAAELIFHRPGTWYDAPEPELLASRMRLPGRIAGGVLTDSRGNRFRVEYDAAAGLTFLRPFAPEPRHWRDGSLA